MENMITLSTSKSEMTHIMENAFGGNRDSAQSHQTEKLTNYNSKHQKINPSINKKQNLLDVRY